LTVDNLPEYTRYRDEGCEAAPSCLNCPFPRCLEESPRARQVAATAVIARHLTTLRRQGMTSAQIARACGKSRRTVQRLLKLAREKGTACHSEGHRVSGEAGGEAGTPAPDSPRAPVMT